MWKGAPNLPDGGLGCRYFAVVLVLLFMLARPDSIGAGSGTVSVTATSNAMIVTTFSGGPVSFDASSGSAERGALSPAAVVVYRAEDSSRGSYYVWRGTGSGITAAVKSNRTWDGSIRVSPEASGPMAAAIAAGALRFTLGEPRSYVDCENSAVLGWEPTAWAIHHPKGARDFTFYYCLRADPGQGPAAFDGSIVYTVVQSEGAALHATR